MDRWRAAGALLALAACIACSAAAPTTSDHTALDMYDAIPEGCYYNFRHYGEGDRIMTNEPCLNCTCHNRMLMCYLRVCPFTKPIGQDCTVEKRADQCCPIVTCPDVPVDLLTSTSTTSPAEYGATGLGKLDKYGCSINGKYLPEGSKVPSTPNKPCEHCYCIRNMTTCVMQECTLHVEGCTPIYHKDVCCPVRYVCDHPEDEIPLLDDMTTTVRPTPGFLLTTTTLAPVTQMTQDCIHDDQVFPDGALIKTEKACEHCYCMKGDIVCVVQDCGTPMENEGKNCTSLPPREGQCCPDTYICEGDELPTEIQPEFTTVLSTEEFTTLSPPRRVSDEGSGYRNEPDETLYTKMPPLESELEGSGEEHATPYPQDTNENAIPEKQKTDVPSEVSVTTKDGQVYVPSTTQASTFVEDVSLTTTSINTPGDIPGEESHKYIPSTTYSSLSEEAEGVSNEPTKVSDVIDHTESSESDQYIPFISTTGSPAFGNDDDTTTDINEEQDLHTDYTTEKEVSKPELSISSTTSVPEESEKTTIKIAGEYTTTFEKESSESDLLLVTVTNAPELSKETSGISDLDDIGHFSTISPSDLHEKVTIEPTIDDLLPEKESEKDTDHNMPVTSVPQPEVVELDTTTPSEDKYIGPEVVSETESPDFDQYITTSSPLLIEDEKYVTETIKDQGVVSEQIPEKDSFEHELQIPGSTGTPMLEEIEKETEQTENVSNNSGEQNTSEYDNYIPSTTITSMLDEFDKASTEIVTDQDNMLHKTTEKEDIESHKYIPSTTNSPGLEEGERFTTEPDSGLNTVPSGTADDSSQSQQNILTTTKNPMLEDSEITIFDQDKVKEEEANLSDKTTLAEETKTTEASFGIEDKYTHEPVITVTTLDTMVVKEDQNIITTEATFSKEDDATSPAESYKEPDMTTITQTVKDNIGNTETTPFKAQGVTFTTSLPPQTVQFNDSQDKKDTVSLSESGEDTISTTIAPQMLPSTINPGENEIHEEFILSPGRIPGEGDCLLNGITYKNESDVPSTNRCHSSCRCISSIIKCDPIICSPPPEYMNNCQPTYDSQDSCCPTYICDSKETIPPESHSQMAGTEAPVPGTECRGDQCDLIEDKKESTVPSCTTSDCLSESDQITGTSQCGPTGCDDNTQKQPTPQTDNASDCSDGKCALPTENCINGECQQPSLQEHLCDGENNCQVTPVKPCEGDCDTVPENIPQACIDKKDCKEINTPEILVAPCEGDSGTGECSTNILPQKQSPHEETVCNGENDCKTAQESQECTEESCKRKDTTPLKEQPPQKCEGNECTSITESSLMHDVTGLSEEKQTSEEASLGSTTESHAINDELIKETSTIKSVEKDTSSEIVTEKQDLPIELPEHILTETELTSMKPLEADELTTKTEALSPQTESSLEEKEPASHLTQTDIVSKLPEEETSSQKEVTTLFDKLTTEYHEAVSTQAPGVITTENQAVETEIITTASSVPGKEQTKSPQLEDASTELPSAVTHSDEDTTEIEITQDMSTKPPATTGETMEGDDIAESHEQATLEPENVTQHKMHITEAPETNTIYTESSVPLITKDMKVPETTEREQIGYDPTQTPELFDTGLETDTKVPTLTDIDVPVKVTELPEINKVEEASTVEPMVSLQEEVTVSQYEDVSVPSQETELKITEPSITDYPEGASEISKVSGAEVTESIAIEQTTKTSSDVTLNLNQDSETPFVSEEKTTTLPLSHEVTTIQFEEEEDKTTKIPFVEQHTESFSQGPEMPLTELTTAPLPEEPVPDLQDITTSLPESFVTESKELTTKTVESVIPDLETTVPELQPESHIVSPHHEEITPESSTLATDIKEKITTAENPQTEEEVEVSQVTESSESEISKEQTEKPELPETLYTNEPTHHLPDDEEIKSGSATKVPSETHDIKTEYTEPSITDKEVQPADTTSSSVTESENILTDSPESAMAHEEKIDVETSAPSFSEETYSSIPDIVTEKMETSVSEEQGSVTLEASSKAPEIPLVVSTEINTENPSVLDVDDSSVSELESVVTDSSLLYDTEPEPYIPVHHKPEAPTTSEDTETELPEKVFLPEQANISVKPDGTIKPLEDHTTKQISTESLEIYTEAPQDIPTEEKQSPLPELATTASGILINADTLSTDVPESPEMSDANTEPPNASNTQEQISTEVPVSVVTEIITTKSPIDLNNEKETTEQEPVVEQEPVTDSVELKPSEDIHTEEPELYTTISQDKEVTESTKHKEEDETVPVSPEIEIHEPSVTESESQSTHLPQTYDEGSQTKAPEIVMTEPSEEATKMQPDTNIEHIFTVIPTTEEMPDSQDTSMLSVTDRTETEIVTSERIETESNVETTTFISASHVSDLSEPTTKVPETTGITQMVEVSSKIPEEYSPEQEEETQTELPASKVTETLAVIQGADESSTMPPQKETQVPDTFEIEKQEILPTKTEESYTVLPDSITEVVSTSSQYPTQVPDVPASPIEEITKLPDISVETSVPKIEYPESTPYFIELEEHTHKVMEDIAATVTDEEHTTEHSEIELSEQEQNMPGEPSQKPTNELTETTSKQELSSTVSGEIPSASEGPSSPDVYKTTIASIDELFEKTTHPSFDIIDTSSISPLSESETDNKDDSEKHKDISSTTTTQQSIEQTTPTIVVETEQSHILNTELVDQEDKILSETENPVQYKPELSSEAPSHEGDLKPDIVKTTTNKIEDETITQVPESADKITKPEEKPSEMLPSPIAPETQKPTSNEIQPTDEISPPEEDGQIPSSGTSGYGQEPDYLEEDQAFGPGTCRYGGKVYVSAQQIPRDDPCDFCFCFRSDIICLQQSCPPPIHGCHEEPIQGFCCPRYECPVSMATTLNVTTTTTTTTTTLPPHFPTHSYMGSAQKKGCQIKGHTYKVGEVVRASSGPCLHCTCGGDGQMKCDPKACTPEPMLRQMIAAAVSAKRRR